MDQKHVALYSNSNTTSNHEPQVERNYWYCMQNNQWKIIGDQLQMKNSIELKDNSNILIVRSISYLVYLTALMLSLRASKIRIAF